MTWNYVDISGITVETPSNPRILPSRSPLAQKVLTACDSAYLMEATCERFGTDGGWLHPSDLIASKAINSSIPLHIHNEIKSQNNPSARTWVDGIKRTEERIGIEGGTQPSYNDIYGVGTLATTDAEIASAIGHGAMDASMYMHLYQDLNKFKYRCFMVEGLYGEFNSRHTTSGAPDGFAYSWLLEDRGQTELWRDMCYTTTSNIDFKLSDLNPYYPTSRNVKQGTVYCLMSYGIYTYTLDRYGSLVGSNQQYVSRA